jgi:hypothetical protein
MLIRAINGLIINIKNGRAWAQQPRSSDDCTSRPLVLGPNYLWMARAVSWFTAVCFDYTKTRQHNPFINQILFIIAL